jgi:hypothetical protein
MTPRMRRAAVLVVLQAACGTTLTISDGGPPDAGAAVPACTLDSPCGVASCPRRGERRLSQG